VTTETRNFSAWMRGADIHSSINRCETIFNSGVLNSAGTANVLFESAITHLLININDLLQKARVDGKRIGFTDDVNLPEGSSDVTDLVKICRNAACHVSSGEHMSDTNKFSFCVMAGLNPSAFTVNDVTMGCDYADDFAIYYGTTRIYVKRHMLRAFEQVAAAYTGMPVDNNVTDQK